MTTISIHNGIFLLASLKRLRC